MVEGVLGSHMRVVLLERDRRLFIASQKGVGDSTGRFALGVVDYWAVRLLERSDAWLCKQYPGPSNCGVTGGSGSSSIRSR